MTYILLIEHCSSVQKPTMRIRLKSSFYSMTLIDQSRKTCPYSWTAAQAGRETLQTDVSAPPLWGHKGNLFLSGQQNNIISIHWPLFTVAAAERIRLAHLLRVEWARRAIWVSGRAEPKKPDWWHTRHTVPAAPLAATVCITVTPVSRRHHR